MKLDTIDIYELKIPFSRKISHRLFSRQETESLVVAINDAEGTTGFGEGAPRAYVTGETMDRSLTAARCLAGQVIGREIESEAEWLACLADLGKSKLAEEHPAAFCAIEIALFDLWTRKARKPLYTVFNSACPVDRLTFSGVIPFIKDEEAFGQTIRLVKQLNLPALKLKVVDPDSGIAQLTRIRAELGDDIDVRIDANGAFTSGTAIRFLEQAQPLHISAIEQPVAKEDIDGLKTVASATEIPVIADESMYAAKGLQYLLDNRVCDGLNIRLSSCGGFLKSYALYQKAVSQDMMVVLGSHVGESAILSLAGRNLAVLCPKATHLEGSFSKYVLTTDLVDADVSFGLGGTAPIPTGAGLGIDIDRAALARWSERAASIG